MNSDAVRVTIAICTHNRATLLRRTLESVRGLLVEDNVALSVLVIANACTDDTVTVLQQWDGPFSMRWHAESVPGLSVARNRVLSELMSDPPDLLLWIDDDVMLPASWAQSYVDASRVFPSVNVFGGPIDPLFEGSNGSWISDRMEAWGVAFARLDFGVADLEMSDGKWLPFGANFGVRYRAIRDHTFDTRLGVRLKGRLVGEETDFLRRLLEGKQAWRYVAQSRVAHIIPVERQSLDFVKRYFRGVGATEEIANCIAMGDAHVLGLPRWLVLALPMAYAKRARFKWLQPNRHAHAKAYAQCQILIGRCIQSRANSVSRGPVRYEATSESRQHSSSWANPS